MKFKTKIVSDRTAKTACRPTSVIRASDGKVLGVYESRKACAIALGIDSPTVSSILLGYYGKSTKIVDEKHGTLTLVDGIAKSPLRVRIRKPKAIPTPPVGPQVRTLGY
jgi:hypothetical protein